MMEQPPVGRANLPEPLSGVPEQPLVELGHGLPWITLSEINRLVRQQGVAPALARAWVLDDLLRAIPLTPERQRELERQWLEHHGVSRPEELEPWLARQRLLPEDVSQLACQAERLDRFRRHRWGEEVEIHFLRRKPELDQVVYSLLRVSDADLAAELHQRIQEGEASFAALATDHSEGRERHSQGVIGPMPLLTAHPEISSRLRVGQSGQLWPPFQVDRFWIVVRLEEHLPARLDDPTAQRMLEELFEAWLKERVNLVIAGEPLPALPPLPAATEALPTRR
jgi:parvulin-like peptidyl-prolyl isomerase